MNAAARTLTTTGRLEARREASTPIRAALGGATEVTHE